MQLHAALLVTVGSGLGGLARYALATMLARPEFPLGILIVNTFGCFLIGFLLYGGAAAGWINDDVRAFVAVGILGGFTTMSAFAYDTVFLADRQAWTAAALNVLLTIVLCLGATWLGRWSALQVWSAPLA
jgi:CrcB protein